MSSSKNNSHVSTHEAVVINNKTLLSVNMTNVAKLTSINHLMWSRHVHALFDAYDLAGYLDGSTPIPPPTITTEGVETVNPDYSHWKRQDKFVFSVLLGAISPTIQPLLSWTTTAYQIWETLESTYAKPTRGHIKQLRQQIK